MSRNKFSNEQMNVLRANKYVSSLTGYSVAFTHDFKQLVLDNNAKGIGIRETLQSCDIDPLILGRSRIENLVYRFKMQEKRFEGFNRVQGSGRRKTQVFASLEDEIKYLKDKSEYLTQENNFLKKIRALRKG